MPSTHSIWHDTFTVPDRAPLREHVTTDVCVIGAGIAGLSVAYALARAGKRVIVLEKEQIGSGESGRTTAHLANALDVSPGLLLRPAEMPEIKRGRPRKHPAGA